MRTFAGRQRSQAFQPDSLPVRQGSLTYRSSEWRRKSYITTAWTGRLTRSLGDDQTDATVPADARERSA